MPELKSSVIARVEYDPATRVLEVWFHTSGGPYRYYDVPPHKYARLLTVKSAGRYFMEHVRDQHSTNP